jgi:hypothetical protein
MRTSRTYARCNQVRTQGADWSEYRSCLEGFASCKYVLIEVRAATPVRSYCFTVETELIGPAMLNGAPPKHDDMQCVAYVPEMSHFVVLRGRIFVDQL